MSTYAIAGLCMIGLVTLFAGALSISLKAACEDRKLPNRRIEYWDQDEASWVRQETRRTRKQRGRREPRRPPSSRTGDCYYKGILP